MSKTPREAGAVWSGRIAVPLSPAAKTLNDSLPVDRRLWPEELALSREYARTLRSAGVLDDAGLAALLGACDALEDDLAAGQIVLTGEDVHSAVEAELVRRSGDPALRLHTGRSRNDQVGTLVRMRVMSLCEHALEAVRELGRALLVQARAAGNQPAAAHTHLQPAQPVLLAHLWLAHAAALERDELRFMEAREAADLMPLGAGAVAGTPLVYDRRALASRLGFTRLAENSVDAVGDRDYALAYLNAACILGVHLSRLGEDLVQWSAPAYGWVTPPDGYATGSSLLPQKRNPDVFELARGKSARLIANAQRLAVLLKGLPSSYSKDLQEDKEALFDTGDTIATLLPALSGAISALEVDSGRLREALTPDLLAVELADALVAEGVPFREAHAAVGRLWAIAESRGVAPSAIPRDERTAISKHFDDARLGSLTVEASLARRGHAPGGGAESVAAQIARHEARLGAGAGSGNTAEPGARAFARSAGRRSGAEDTQNHPLDAGFVADSGAAPAIGATAGRGADAAGAPARPDGIVIRPARVDDIPGIAALMADYVLQGVLLPRPVSELYQSVREFHVAAHAGEVVACAALRLLWSDLGEVRSLAVRPDHHGKGLGQRLVETVIEDARALHLPRLIALTREVPFFERCGFTTVSRDVLPRKVWTDCVRCPRRHACDEVAVVLDLVPGASERAAAASRSWTLPIPPPLTIESQTTVVS